MPQSGDTPAERLARAAPLAGTPGQSYVERHGIPIKLADATGLRFDPDWSDRAAVLVGLYDRTGTLRSVHGRYLSTLRVQDMMLTIGPGGDVFCVGHGWHGDPLILVEGVFDALSLAVCGYSGVATIGRWAPWLPEACAGRVAWLGFDGNAGGWVRRSDASAMHCNPRGREMARFRGTAAACDRGRRPRGARARKRVDGHGAGCDPRRSGGATTRSAARRLRLNPAGRAAGQRARGRPRASSAAGSRSAEHSPSFEL